MSEFIVGRYTDISTPEHFSFIFHCERCGSGCASETYLFNADEFAQPTDTNTRALLWVRQHQSTYVKASVEAQFAFNISPSCGHRVCENCFHMDVQSGHGSCLGCKQGLREPSPHAPHEATQWEGRETGLCWRL